MPYKDPIKQRDAARKWARNNKGNATRNREASKALILEAKARPCMDCGNTFPTVCMDFDHRDDEDKVSRVSAMRHYSLDKLRAEIEKCDVVCSNCHRIRTVSKGQHLAGGKIRPRKRRDYRLE